jgi:hypothetical protein
MSQQIHEPSRIKEIMHFLGTEWEFINDRIEYRYHVRLRFKKQSKKRDNNRTQIQIHSSTPTTTTKQHNAWPGCFGLSLVGLFQGFGFGFGLSSFEDKKEEVEVEEPTTHTHPYTSRFQDLFPDYYFRAHYIQGEGAYILIGLKSVKK